MGRHGSRGPASAFACLAVLGIAFVLIRHEATPVLHAAVPERLSDQAFWQLSQNSSEPGGYFRSQDITNLTSNEMMMQFVIQDLVSRTEPGEIYLGVGPEQNYTYIAAMRPSMAVIFDLRRGNLDLQLMYKAMFELAADRADFISMLFAKPRPSGLTRTSTVSQLFNAFSAVATSDTLYASTLKAIEAHLTRTHALPLGAQDLSGIEAVYHEFYWSGFAVRPSPTYADLMMQTDATGVARSYLSSEERFGVMKDLESRNLVVPVVGNFEGPKAIRAVAAYLKTTGGTVGAFYLSNVEQYLNSWDTFCRNVATLPLDRHSTFIRSVSGGGFSRGGSFVSSLGSMADEVKACK